MNEIKQLLSDPLNSIVIVFLLFVAFKWIYELVSWYKLLFTKKHEKINEEEKCHNIVLKMQDVSTQHTESLIELSSSIKELHEDIKTLESFFDQRMNELKTELNEDIIAMGRSMLYRLYEELKDEPSLTMAQYETFKHVSDIYLAAGGNGAFRNRLIKEILNKPIKEEID